MCMYHNISLQRHVYVSQRHSLQTFHWSTESSTRPGLPFRNTTWLWKSLIARCQPNFTPSKMPSKFYTHYWFKVYLPIYIYLIVQIVHNTMRNASNGWNLITSRRRCNWADYISKSQTVYGQNCSVTELMCVHIFIFHFRDLIPPV